MFNHDILVRQQQVLKYLGYYRGRIDGIWSTKTASAKIAFERSGKFNPGIPSNGMPFRPGLRLPKGLAFDGSGLLTVPGVDFSAPEYAPYVAEIDDIDDIDVQEQRTVAVGDRLVVGGEVASAALDQDDDVSDEDVATVPDQAFDPAIGTVRQLSRKERKKLFRQSKAADARRTIPITERIVHADGTTSVNSSTFSADIVVDPEQLVNG